MSREPDTTQEMMTSGVTRYSLFLADALNRKGFAVLRYDKRGVGGSSGDYETATTADFASDAGAAVAWLKTQAEIDRSRIGVLGHSEGGTIAPAVAATDKGVAFVVMIAGPCIRGDRLFVLQSAMTAKAYGAPDDYIARRKVFDQQLCRAIFSAPSESAALDRAKALVAQGVADKLVDANEAKSLPNDAPDSHLAVFTQKHAPTAMAPASNRARRKCYESCSRSRREQFVAGQRRSSASTRPWSGASEDARKRHLLYRCAPNPRAPSRPISANPRARAGRRDRCHRSRRGRTKGRRPRGLRMDSIHVRTV